MKRKMGRVSKKWVIGLLAVLLLIGINMVSSQAATEGYLSYTVKNGVVTITDCDTSASGELVIPETIAGYPVMSIGQFAFEDCSNLVSIRIPTGLTNIGNFAFSGCSSLASINIPAEVVEIGNYVFNDCTNLADVYITDLRAWCEIDFNISTFESNPLYYADNLYLDGVKVEGELIIPEGVTDIGGAFYSYSSLTSVIIPSGVTSIGERAFYDCDNLESVDIPSTVTSIGGYAFAFCEKLVDISIPDGVTSIGSHAFAFCEKLVDINIPSGITSIEEGTFYYCMGLTGINIPSGVTSIGDKAFYSCDNLESVDVPSTVTSIGRYAFAFCGKLVDINIPDGVTNLGEGAFDWCDSLTNINIPSGITSIENSTFYRCKGLTGINIPSGVTSIGDEAFYGCDNLESVEVPSTVTNIGDEAFANCSDLVLIVNSIYAKNYAEANNIEYILNLKSLIVKTMPDKTEYCLNEAFNTNGMSIYLDHGDGTGQYVTDDCQLNGFDSSKAGKYTITAKYDEYQTSFEITVYGTHSFDSDNICNICQYKRIEKSLEIKSMPNKTEYGLNEQFDSSGLVLDMNYTDGTIEEITSGFSISGFDSSKAGTCTVTIQYGEKTTTFKVVVKEMTLTGISFTVTNLNLYVGDTYQSEIIYTPTNATNKSVSWKTLNASVASVDADGIILAVSEGSAMIQATSENGLVAECTVTVSEYTVPGAVARIGSRYFMGIEEAVAYSDNSEMVLLDSVGKIEVPQGKTIVIDTNGKSIGQIVNSGNLTIVNSSKTQTTISITSSGTTTENDSVVVITNEEGATLSLENINVQVTKHLRKTAYQLWKFSVDIRVAVNKGTMSLKNCKFIVSGVCETNYANASLLVYGIENYSVLDVQDSYFSLTGEASTSEDKEGYYGSCNIWGIYNDSDEEVNVNDSAFNIVCYVNSSSYFSDESGAIYTSGNADFNIESTDVICALSGCRKSIYTGIYGIKKLGSGTMNISNAYFDVNATGYYNNSAHAYGIYGLGDLNVGVGDTLTTIHVATDYGRSCGIYSGNTNVGNVEIMAVCEYGTSGTGISIDGGIVKIGEQNDMYSLSPVIYGSLSPVSNYSGTTGGVCYVYSGMYGCNHAYPMNSLEAIYPEGSRLVYEEKDGVTFVTLSDIYYITYELNGGTWSDDTAMEMYTYGISLPLSDKIEKDGYDFQGWYDNAQFEGEPITEITADTCKDLTLHAKWTKNVTVTDLSINKTSVNIKIDDSVTLIATCLPIAPAAGELIWSSGDESIVTVDQNGKVTAVGLGTAIISVSIKDSNLVAQCTITVKKDDTVNRIYGSTRYKTAFKTADALKEQLGIEKFDVIIVANGNNFADALSGSYLAGVKNAPILMMDGTNITAVCDYINNNLNAGGTVYLLGGKSVLPETLESALSNYNVKRLWGNTRYGTNLAILKEAGVGKADILVCTGNGFADSLSASATKRPILLVGGSLTKAQKEFLENLSGNKFYIIGGVNAVSTGIEAEIQAYGNTERIGGASRFRTSVMIAEKFFENPQSAVIAYAYNFPDGLSGGPLAMSMDAPLILSAGGSEGAASAYMKKCDITSGAVLGGPGILDNSAVQKIFNLESESAIKVW